MPILLVYCFTLLFKTLGLSFFSGIGVFVVAFITNLFIGLVIEKQYKEIMKRKDKRMSHTTEAIQNIKTLKLYSWTEIFQAKVQKRREYEFKKYRAFAVTITLIITSLYFFPNVLSTVVFSTYIGTGNNLTLAKAFTTLIFFDLIKEPIRQLPTFLSEFLELLVSMKRI